MRVITNTASVHWTANGANREQTSNRVDLRLDNDEPGLPSLDIYRLTRNGDTYSLAGASCTAADGTITPFTFPGVWATVPVGQVPLARATEIKPGEPLIFGVSHQWSNRNPAAIDTKEIVFSSGDDSETILMVETGTDTGYFMGALMTRRTPPAAVKGDCLLSVDASQPLDLGASEGEGLPPFSDGQVGILIDPYGIAFDSRSGDHISNVKISVVDAETGVLGEVYGDDGVSRYPSVVYTGQTVVDAGGTVYDFPPGDYRFPLMPPGRYRLVVEPVAPYSFPSERTPAEMADLLRPDGQQFALPEGSFGGVIELFDPAPVRVDIPLDRPGNGILLTKTASEVIGIVGDTIQYRIAVRNPDPTRSTGIVTLTDFVPPQMRLRPDTLRLDGEKIEGQVGENGTLTVTIPKVARGATAVLTYALEIRADAEEGDALNRVTATDSFGNSSNVADVLVRVQRDAIADRMTIIGRVVDGACTVDPATAPGIPGVRVMLEDGSYAVTDFDGRYHFEGVKPGTHVVQVDEATLPGNRALVDCAQNSRSAGRAFSRFVDGRGGGLKRLDFRAAPVEGKAAAAEPKQALPEILTDPEAAGAGRDWFAGQTPGIAWLFPGTEQNPRARITRVAIKHGPDQSVKLYSNGREISAMTFDGVQKSADKKMAVSAWRGLTLEEDRTVFTAEVLNADGSLAEKLERAVYFSDTPIQAEFLAEKSVLAADGVTRPVIAVRLTDRYGRPVHHGLVGDFEVPAPYYPAVEAAAQQARQLAGLGRARPVWRVHGDEGIAYIELEPTTASGAVSIRFTFRDRDVTREQRIEAWLDPGNRPWTIVGLAEGTAGFNKLQGRVEELKDEDDNEVLTDGRLALYAKGRVLGKWLMTLSYDSDKDEDETRFAGVIDPHAYYTIYADMSERRYDAASVRRLYLRLERPQFYALFGDYVTGIDQPYLARYVRAFNGLKAEYGSSNLSAVAFASDTPNRHRRDEIQGNGLSGPYALGARDILANSERIVIEVRDRERSDRIVDTRYMTRHIDYDIDYRAGTLRFREPILSRDSSLNPQFIVADYEVDGVGSRDINAGGRVTYRTDDQALQVGATVIHDDDSQTASKLAGADVRYRPAPTTEIRAEVAVSDKTSDTARETDGTATAWLVEAEHHGQTFDVLAYVRQQEEGFGVGQTNAAENGARKVGVDGRIKITNDLSVTGSGWHEDYLASDQSRVAGRALLEYRGQNLNGRAGVTLARDKLADGRTASSTLVQLGATRRFLDNKLELDAQTELPVGGQNDSIDFPAKHRLAARYAIDRGVQLVGAYEVADGEHVDARTARLGFDLQPWAGARIAASGNFQTISEFGPRTFAAFGLSQSLVLNKNWSIDVSADSNQTLSGIDPDYVLNPEHPVSAGGYIGGGAITEDFAAFTAGATYRADEWSITGRGEYRFGDLGDRYGLTIGALRQIGDGQALGGAINHFTATSRNGAQTRTANAQLSWAFRPSDSRFSFLEKLELRHDRVTGAIFGDAGPIGIPLTVSGDAASLRVINSLSMNWSPGGGGDGEWLDRSELSLFWGSRYASDKFGADDVDGWSNVIGIDGRYDVSQMFDLGGAFTVRQGSDGRSFAYSGGPSLGIAPFENGWISLGWNLVGFIDRDFEENRYTRAGPYVTMRFKFDQMTLQGLGLGR